MLLLPLPADPHGGKRNAVRWGGGDGSQGDQDARVNSDQSDVTLVGHFFSFYIPLHRLSSPTVPSAIPLLFSVQLLFRRLSRHTIRR